MLAEGWRVKQIAAIMQLSYDTMMQEIHCVRIRFGAETTAHAIAILFRKGILS